MGNLNLWSPRPPILIRGGYDGKASRSNVVQLVGPLVLVVWPNLALPCLDLSCLVLSCLEVLRPLLRVLCVCRVCGLQLVLRQLMATDPPE